MENKFEQIEKKTSEGLDEILGKPFAVLNDGFIRVVDYMGNDESIVQAARVSYGKGTKKLNEDKSLIRYLLRHRHTTPFEMCEIKFHIRVPMDTWRQWIRHRTASVNEYSTRYSIAIDSMQSTSEDEWRGQAQWNKQGSEGFLDVETGAKLSEDEILLHKTMRNVYDKRIELGVAREQARKDLPLSTYTEAYWKIDLHNLLHFLELRMDKHAQAEIREYATIIGNEIVKRWCPIAWDAFNDYILNSKTFSRFELEVITGLMNSDIPKAIEAAEKAGWLEKNEKGLKSNIERLEFESKLATMGIKLPW
ncbi:MAG: FAD-dependent thymidylate synthase [bacterium]